MIRFHIRASTARAVAFQRQKRERERGRASERAGDREGMKGEEGEGGEEKGASSRIDEEEWRRTERT